MKTTNSLQASAFLTKAGPLSDLEKRRIAIQGVLLPRVLSNEASFEDSLSLLKAFFDQKIAESDPGTRDKCVQEITSGAFHPSSMQKIISFLESGDGLVGELNGYPPNQQAELKDHQRALLNWVLYPAQHQPVLNSPHQYRFIKPFWADLARSTVLSQADYVQLEHLSSARHDPRDGVRNPNEPIRFALASNPQTPPLQLTRLTATTERQGVRLAAVENLNTPKEAIRNCLAQDDDISVLVAAITKLSGKRNAADPLTEDEQQLRTRNIEGLNQRLDIALINQPSPARRRLFE
jgi:hypothetical protein